MTAGSGAEPTKTNARPCSVPARGTSSDRKGAPPDAQRNLDNNQWRWRQAAAVLAVAAAVGVFVYETAKSAARTAGDLLVVVPSRLRALLLARP